MSAAPTSTSDAARPLRVAVVMPLSEQRGGSEVLLEHLVRYGRGGTMDVRVLFFEDGPMVAAFRALGVPVAVLGAGRLRQPGPFARAAIRVWAYARREQIDLVVGWSAKAHLYAGPAAWAAGVPAAWFQHGIPDGRHAMDLAATRIPARGVFACSAAAARAQEALRPRRETAVVYPSADLARFNPARLPSPAGARVQLGLSPDGPLIGIVGRLQRWKGMHTLVEAFPAVLARHPDARAVVVGGRHEMEPDYEAHLHARIAALGLEDRVLIAGFQSDVPLWTQAFDVVVHASDREPFGIVVVEAMALGKPVVAGASGGPLEVITDGVDGLLTPFDDAPALAAALVRLLGDPAAAHAMGEAARTRAQAFSAEAFAARFEEAARALLALR